MTRRIGLRLAGAAVLTAMVVISPQALMGSVRAEPTSRVAELFESSFANEASGKNGKALEDVLKILKIDGQHYVATLRAGWLNYMKKRYSESVRFYKRAASMAPKAIEPQLGLMLPLMASKRWKEAERVGKWIMKVAPRNYLAGRRLAYIAFSQGKYKAAETRYMSVWADHPSDVEMMLGLGWTYRRQGRKADARKMFETVLSIRRKNANAKAGLEGL